MKIGFVGLGRMGMNMVQRLLNGGHDIVAYARSEPSIRTAVEKGAAGAGSLEEIVNQLNTPRVIWLMVPAGDATEESIQGLAPLLSDGDLIIDGGNSMYKNSI